MQNSGPCLTFQHDNARPHTALVTANFLAQNNVKVLPWSAYPRIWILSSTFGMNLVEVSKWFVDQK